MTTPLVTIIIPVYGVEKYLSECLDSILAQSYGNIEVILVDDKTPDRSGEIADEYATRDKRIKVIHKPKNEGLNMARATGYAESTGELVTFIDSDDKVLPEYIEKLIKTQRMTGADITMCGYMFYDAELKNPLPDQPIRQHPIEVEPSTYTKSQMIHYYLTQWDYWSHNNNTSTTCCKLFTRKVLGSIDWQDTNYSIGEDDFETIYTLTFADKYAVINDQMYLYRANPNSISNSNKFTPKYKGEPISAFDICHDFENKALRLLGSQYENEIYYRTYTLFRYYIDLLIKKHSLSTKDAVVFDKYFPIEKIKTVKNYSIDGTMLSLVENGGLVSYVTNSLIGDIENKQERIRDVESYLDRTSKDLALANRELTGYLGIKRSARLFAGNIKRRVQKKLKKLTGKS